MAGRATYHHGDLAEAALDEALRLIEADPPAQFSVRALAERLGVAHRALYNHFEAREDLLAATAARGFDHLAEALTACSDPQSFVTTYAGFALAQPGLYAVMMRRTYEQFENHPALRRAADRVIAVSLGVLATPGADEETRRREVMRLWMLVHGAIGLHRSGVLRLRSDSDFVAEILCIAGLAPDAPQPGQPLWRGPKENLP